MFLFLLCDINKMHIKIMEETEPDTSATNTADADMHKIGEDVVGEYVNLSNNLPSTLSQRFSALQTNGRSKPDNQRLDGVERPELFCVSLSPTDVACPTVKVSQFINVPQTNDSFLQFVVLEISANGVVSAFCTGNGHTYEIDTSKYVIEPLKDCYTIQYQVAKNICYKELERINNIPENVTTDEIRKDIARIDEKFRKLIPLYEHMFANNTPEGNEGLILSLKLSRVALALEGYRKAYLAELIEQLESELDI